MRGLPLYILATISMIRTWLFSDARDLRLLERGASHRAVLVRADAGRRHLAAAERRLPPPEPLVVAGRRAAALCAAPQVSGTLPSRLDAMVCCPRGHGVMDRAFA